MVEIGGFFRPSDGVLPGGEFIWRPAGAWDIAAEYRYFSRKIDSDTFFNEVSYHIPFVSITRFW